MHFRKMIFLVYFLVKPTQNSTGRVHGMNMIDMALLTGEL